MNMSLSSSKDGQNTFCISVASGSATGMAGGVLCGVSSGISSGITSWLLTTVSAEKISC